MNDNGDSIEITLEMLESDYAPMLDTVGQILNANPNIIPEGSDAMTLAMGVQSVGNALYGRLAHESKQIVELKQRAEKAEKNFSDQIALTQKYFLMLSKQNNQIKDLEAGIIPSTEAKDKEVSWEDIQKAYEKI